MKTAYPATLQDIIFEGRNKAYGAYLLRRMYPRHIWQGLILAIAFFVVLITLPILVGKLFAKDDFVEPSKPGPVITMTTVVLPDTPPLGPQPETGPKEPPKPLATLRDVTMRVVDNDKPVTDVIPPRDAVAQTTAGLVTSNGEGDATIDNPELGGGTGTGLGTGEGSGTPSTPPVEPFLSVQEMPEFEGGLAKLMEFVSRNIRYPDSARRNKIEGTVVVSFVVEPSGYVGEVTVLKGLGYGTEEEAIRVVKKMPRWKPGIQNGRKVPVRMTLPLRLELRN